MTPITLEVRHDSHGPAVALITRTPRQHKGWQSVRYANKRHQLLGGIRCNYFLSTREKQP